MTIHNPHMLPRVESKALTQAVRGMPCALRLSSLYPGWHCASPETVVACHIGNLGKGTSLKTSDIFIAAGCHHCHDIADGRDKKRQDWLLQTYPRAFMERLMFGVFETQLRLHAMGLIEVTK